MKRLLSRVRAALGGRDRGSSAGGEALEMAILGPTLLLIFAVIIAAGRISVGSSHVDQAADAAAAAAAQQSNAADARTAAQAQAASSLASAGITCENMQVTVDTSGFAAPAGAPASVNVQVSCTVQLADLAIKGLPGAKTLTSSAASPLDVHQERG